ncbi:hypothetical protein B0T16DRAFT_448994 [Cercophora newfieldiana]|uniref:Uncharacterized protein n=1 Tax=Cercophora newfieldiana TaxID=92897 RepID=A0AA39XWJ8_9PEZI|nr:hypothetical protein B0T16DRAFT_448994 [Cercophora newfieldiana]
MASKKFAALLEDDSASFPAWDARCSTALGGGDAGTSDLDFDPSRQSISCVTRETFQEDCARHRFIVWAAVKRNSSPGMRADKKLECPLLKCNRRFPDHESMLRHLAGCRYLASGEYWCYYHNRVERFDDLKCKRCIGHPSKRKKMLFMAKSFFHSLGHKSKKNPVFGYDDDDSSLLQPPPSYDSLDIPLGHATELSSNEIVEIDSREVITPLLDSGINPQALLVPSLPELDSAMQSVDPFTMQWPPSTSFPYDLDDCGSRVAGVKPALQVTTHGLPPRRHAAPRPAPREVPSVPRSKGLSPSSSVRSTASTDTTASTNSNVSSLLSPSSNWSGIWSVPSGLNTSLTSPIEALPEDPWANAEWDPHTFCSELPADFPISKPAETLQLDPIVSFQPAQPVDVLFGSELRMSEDLMGLTDMEEPELGEDNCCSETKSVVGSAWDALQEHLLSSTLKIQDIHENHLAGQLKPMSPKTIAASGLRTLRTLLDGGQPSSAIDTLCFVHLMYAFSLAVHEKGASRNLKPFFLQSLSYVHSLPPNDRRAYTQLAIRIWQPADIEQAVLSDYFSAAPTPSLSRSSSLKGKEREVHSADSLLSAARDFLDELEMSLVTEQAPSSLEVRTSELYTKHLLDIGSASPVNQDFAQNMGYLLDTLSGEYSDAVSLREKAGEVCQRVNDGVISSVRRAEIEMLSAGKDCMPAQRFFDSYTPKIRILFDMLYEKHDTGTSRRNTYHQAGISLVERLIPEFDRPAGGAIFDEHEDFDALFEDLTTSTLDYELGHMSPTASCDTSVLRASTVVATSFEGSSANPSGIESHPNQESTRGDALDQQGQKVEADACCDICGYRPKGDPQWFKGSLAKHKKLQHSAAPPKIYKCPYPGCTSQYKNRPDNLRQHQIEKNHWLDGEATTTRRPSKRKKLETDE